MKPHTRTTTSRVLSECDIEKSIYDNNPDMKYVKENFDRQHHNVLKNTKNV